MPQVEDVHQTDSSAVSRDRKGPGCLPIQGINHVSREVIDLQASLNFYIDVLGFRRIPRPNIPIEGAWIHGHGISIHLIVSDDVERMRRMEEFRLRHFEAVGTSVDHIAFLSEEFETVEELLKAHSITYIKNETDFGATQLFFPDPDGNIIEVGNCAPPVGETTCDAATNSTALSKS
eukprot:GILK01007180.1.p1 GENE.GILK01007180.1~~GILK01007180.1.p1  ORF type:complete len:177 (-),score=17.91 GILK01007180.1:180-710(-)